MKFPDGSDYDRKPLGEERLAARARVAEARARAARRAEAIAEATEVLLSTPRSMRGFLAAGEATGEAGGEVAVGGARGASLSACAGEASGDSDRDDGGLSSMLVLAKLNKPQTRFTWQHASASYQWRLEPRWSRGLGWR